MNELSAVVRFLNLTASVLLAGGFGFALLIARPAFLRAPGDAKADLPCFLGPQLRAAAWCVVAIFTSAVLGFWLQLMYVGDPEGGASTVPEAAFVLLSETQFGRVWLLRMALLVALAGLIAWGRRAGGHHDAIFLAGGLALSALLLAAVALSGHASAAEGSEFALEVSADTLHLLTCALWLGGLWPLTALLYACRRKGDDTACAVATAAALGFSRLALVGVPLLLASGGFNAWKLVNGFAPLFGTYYGKLLLLKIGVLLPMLGLGAINLLTLESKKSQASGARFGQGRDRLGRIARNAAVEMGLGLVILLIVGHMGVLPPARHVQPDWPFSFRWDWSVLDKVPEARDRFLKALPWVAVGAAAILVAAVRKRGRILAAAVGLGAWVYAGNAVLAAVSTDAYPTTYRRPAVAYQAISVANGKRLYETSGCVLCHGGSGYGDGPLAGQFRPRPADLTAPHASMHTAGDLFWWISHGIERTAMPGFGQKLDEDERWDLINFLRALSGSERARSLEPVVETEPWLIAPDFTYQTGSGSVRRLKDFRGARVVLLVLLGPRDREERLAQLGAALPSLESAGVEAIVVPDTGDRLLAAKSFPGFVVTEGGKEIVESYALLARSFGDEEPLATPPHVEFLIDKQSYVRARWLPAEGDAWKDLSNLLAQADRLKREVPRAPAPDEHVH